MTVKPKIPRLKAVSRFLLTNATVLLAGEARLRGSLNMLVGDRIKAASFPAIGSWRSFQSKKLLFRLQLSRQTR